MNLWQQTTSLDPGNPRGWNNLGWAYFLAARKDDTRQAYQRALQQEPGDNLARQTLLYLDEVKP